MSDDDPIRRGDVLDRFMRGGLHTIQERLDAIRALPAVQPKVKPLVWDKPLGGFHIAKLPFGGEIRIMWDLSLADGERYILHPFSLGRRVFRTLDTAKAAAQADYEVRILSALELAVQPDAQCCMCGKKGLSAEENGGPECELHDGRWVCSENCWNDALESSAAAIREAALNEADYDAGLLNDFGGGNVDWWHDYLRAEIGRANEYWRALIDNAAVQPDAAAIREAALVAVLKECADDLESYVEHAYPIETRDKYPTQEAKYARDMEPVVKARALIDNPGKEVMPSEQDNTNTRSDTAPAGLSAGGGAVYDAVREAIQKMVGRRDEYGIPRWSANRAIAILRDMEARNCPAPRLLVEDGRPVLTWVIGGWKLYQYCDEEETQAFHWQGPPATDGGA
jgi:hypothetical protein